VTATVVPTPGQARRQAWALVASNPIALPGQEEADHNPDVVHHGALRPGRPA